MSDDPEIHYNPELWLQYLLTHLGSNQSREELVAHFSQKTGLAPEKVEIIFHALLEYLLNQTRSN
jgi:hypothetical protein